MGAREWEERKEVKEAQKKIESRVRSSSAVVEKQRGRVRGKERFKSITEDGFSADG